MRQPPPGADAPRTRLKERVHSNLQGEFIAARWPGHNASGLSARGLNVLVKMDQMAARTAGGVFIPDEAIERQNEASETGCIFDVGGLAQRLMDAGETDSLKVGQRVYIEKYAGVKALGRDGLIYRMMDEKAIAGLIDFGYADDESFGEESREDAA